MKTILLFTVALLFTTTAHAQKKELLQDKEVILARAAQALDAAIQRSGGVTVDLNDAQSEAYSAWDKELNRVYAQLLKAAGPSRRDALRAAQRAWLAFDTAQAQWDGTLLADQGTSTSVNLIAGALSRRRARVCDLRVDLDSLQATQ